MTLTDIALIIYILIFAVLVTLAWFLDVKVHWGGRTGMGVPMSRRSKTLLVATAWFAMGMTVAALFQLPAVAGPCAGGFVLGVVVCMVSGMVDYHQERRRN